MLPDDTIRAIGGEVTAVTPVEVLQSLPECNVGMTGRRDGTGSSVEGPIGSGDIHRVNTISG